MVENFFNLIAITLVIFLWAVFKIKARYNLFNKLVDRIIIGEVLDNDKEDLYILLLFTSSICSIYTI